jgi:hypothetical protein
MDQNQLAITVRQHAVRESYEKALHNNLQALKKEESSAWSFGQVHNTRSSQQMSTATADVGSFRPGDPGRTHDY